MAQRGLQGPAARCGGTLELAGRFQPQVRRQARICSIPVQPSLRSDDQFQRDGIHWTTLDGNGGNWGWVWLCYAPITGYLHWFQIIIDKQEINWYSGTGAIQKYQKDLRSVATHEFGHATGFFAPCLHFADQCASAGEDCTDFSVGKETMCKVTGLGDIVTRDISDHDLHTFTAQY